MPCTCQGGIHVDYGNEDSDTGSRLIAKGDLILPVGDPFKLFLSPSIQWHPYLQEYTLIPPRLAYHQRMLTFGRFQAARLSTVRSTQGAGSCRALQGGKSRLHPSSKSEERPASRQRQWNLILTSVDVYVPRPMGSVSMRREHNTICKLGMFQHSCPA